MVTAYTHSHSHTLPFVYVCMYMCVCVCTQIKQIIKLSCCRSRASCSLLTSHTKTINFNNNNNNIHIYVYIFIYSEKWLRSLTNGFSFGFGCCSPLLLLQLLLPLLRNGDDCSGFGFGFFYVEVAKIHRVFLRMRVCVHVCVRGIHTKFK